jgi:hypothetical protein
LAEYNMKNQNTGFIIGMPPPEIMGGALRDAGARAIVCSMDSRSGGVTTDHFRRFTVEQSRARLFMPQPIPVVWHDYVVDHVQISQAAAYGAAAITLHYDFIEDMEAAVTFTKEQGIEPIVFCTSLKEAQMALEIGAKTLCFDKMNEEQLLSARLALPSKGDDPDLVCIAKLRPEADFSAYSEIDLAWTLRDHAFQSVWPSPDAVFSQGMSDIYPTILAMRAKAGRKFISPRQFLMDRNKEGAQEFLGDILY